MDELYKEIALVKFDVWQLQNFIKENIKVNEVANERVKMINSLQHYVDFYIEKASDTNKDIIKSLEAIKLK